MKPLAVQRIMARRTAACLHAMILLATFGLCLTQQSATPFILLVAVSIAAWLLVDSPATTRATAGGRHPIFLPTWCLNIFVLVGACNLAREVIRDAHLGAQSVIVPLSHFILFLLAGKLFERKTLRDVAQIVLLAFLVLLAAAMYSSSGIGFCIVLCAFLALAVYAAAVLHLGAESMKVTAAPDLPAAFAGNGTWAPLQRDLRIMAKACVLLAVPAGVFVFLAMPRTRSSSFAASLGFGAVQTGYTNVVQPRDSGTVVESNAIVMQVRITSGGQAVGSRYEDPYFRGSVQEMYWVGGWRNRHDNLENDPKVAVIHPTAGHPAPTPTLLWGEDIRPGDIRQEFHVFASKNQVLFSIATPVAFESSKVESVTLPPGELRISSNGPFESSPDYVVYSRPGYVPPGAEGEPFIEPGRLYPESVKESALTWEDRGEGMTNTAGFWIPYRSNFLDKVPDKIADIARKVAKDFTTPEGIVVDPDQIVPLLGVFERYLKSNYPYSLSSNKVDATLDWTQDFLLNRKAIGGNCMYFASAEVMLCRAVGVNARLVSGYHGGEYNSFDGEYVIRERDAHAWVEVYVPGSGWVISDPTPGQSGANPNQGAFALWWNDLSDYVENQWFRFVGNFDDDSRRSVEQWLADQFSGVLASLRNLELLRNLDTWTGASGPTRAGMAGILLGIVGMCTWATTRWRADLRRAAQGGTAAHHALRHAAELGFLDDLLRHLERLGIPRRLHQTPREFADTLRDPLGGVFCDAQCVIDAAYAVQFGGIPLDGTARRRVDESLVRVRASIRTTKGQAAHLPQHPV